VTYDDFDRALELHRDDPAGTVFSGDLDPGWSIGFAINGGVLLAIVGRALGDLLAEHGHPDPLAISAFYLGATTGGPFEISTELVRTGRSVSTAQAGFVQPAEHGTAERVRALATYGALGALDDGEVRTTAKPPQPPPPDQCVRSVDEVPGIDVPLVERLDMRLDPTCIGGILGRPTGRGEMQGWLRHRGGREPDVWTSLLALDVFPPVAMNLGIQGWAPTLELTAHVRAHPAPGWLRVRTWTDNLAGGLFEENAEVWDSADRLVAQARQLARPGRS
jgi:hypothetical protein